MITPVKSLLGAVLYFLLFLPFTLIPAMAVSAEAAVVIPANAKSKS